MTSEDIGRLVQDLWKALDNESLTGTEHDQVLACIKTLEGVQRAKQTPDLVACNSARFTMRGKTMTPTEKIAKRVLVIGSIGMRSHVDFYNATARSSHRISRDNVKYALGRVMGVMADDHGLEWLGEKLDEIHRRGMLWFMDYLDQENLDRLLDPAVDLFPSAGI